MKKRIIVSILAISLLMMMFTAMPVFARMNSKWIPVVINRTGLTAVTGNHWFTEGDTYHLIDTPTGFTSYSITGTGISYVGSSSGTQVVANINLKTEQGKATTLSTIILPGGTFEGVIHTQGYMRIYLDAPPVPVPYRGYTVLWDGTFEGQWTGTGEYEGQKLVLEYTVVNGVVPSPLNGYLFIP